MIHVRTYCQGGHTTATTMRPAVFAPRTTQSHGHPGTTKLTPSGGRLLRQLNERRKALRSSLHRASYGFGFAADAPAPSLTAVIAAGEAYLADLMQLRVADRCVGDDGGRKRQNHNAAPLLALPSFVWQGGLHGGREGTTIAHEAGEVLAQIALARRARAVDAIASALLAGGDQALTAGSKELRVAAGELAAAAAVVDEDDGAEDAKAVASALSDLCCIACYVSSCAKPGLGLRSLARLCLCGRTRVTHARGRHGHIGARHSLLRGLFGGGGGLPVISDLFTAIGALCEAHGARTDDTKHGVGAALAAAASDGLARILAAHDAAEGALSASGKERGFSLRRLLGGAEAAPTATATQRSEQKAPGDRWRAALAGLAGCATSLAKAMAASSGSVYFQEVPLTTGVDDLFRASGCSSFELVISPMEYAQHTAGNPGAPAAVDAMWELPESSDGGSADDDDEEPAFSIPWWGRLIDVGTVVGGRVLRRPPQPVCAGKTHDSIRLRWGPPPPQPEPTMYIMQWKRAEPPGRPWNFFSRPLVTKQCNKHLLSPNTAYIFRVREIVPDGDGDAGDVFGPWSEASEAVTTTGQADTGARADGVAKSRGRQGSNTKKKKQKKKRLQWREISPNEVVFDRPRVTLGRGGFGAVFRSAEGGYQASDSAEHFSRIQP